MRMREVIERLASGYSMRDDDELGFVVAKTAGKVRSDTIGKLMNGGWIERRNGCWTLTDEGRKAFMRSTDELGDGKLIAPEAT